jgi:uncharacterized membrane protein YccC
MLFLFPAYERHRAPQYLRASLSADRRYLAELTTSWRTGSRSSRLLANARRAAGLAHNDAEESLKRLLSESWARPRPLGRFATTFVAYLRRFAQGLTTLTTLEGEWDWKQSATVQEKLALLANRLDWLEDRSATGNDVSMPPWPEASESPRSSHDHPGERQLERLERQTSVLHKQLLSLREHGWLPNTEP